MQLHPAEQSKHSNRIPIEALNKAPSLSGDPPAVASDPDTEAGKSTFCGNVETANNRSNTAATCPECSRTFLSKKALFGHLRCHPERTYRGVYPPSTLPKKRQSDAHYSAATMPFPPALMGPMAMPGRKFGTVDEDEDIEEAVMMKTAHVLLVMSKIARAESTEAKHLMIENGQKSGDKRIKLQGEFKKMQLPNEPGPPPSFVTRYECDVCFKSFSSDQTLGRHKASHTKDKSSPSEDTNNIELINEDPDLSVSLSPQEYSSGNVKTLTNPESSAHSPAASYARASRRPLDLDLNELPPLEEEES